MAEEPELRNILQSTKSKNPPIRTENPNPSRAPRFLCVDYPGVVKNVEKAIETLGGMNKLSFDYYKTAALELDYHRDNVYSRPATSRVRNGTFLIVKARRRKPRPSENEMIDPESDRSDQAPKNEELQGEILGCVSSMHRFTTMFDFQFLPLKRSETNSQKSTYDDIFPELFPVDLKTAADWLPEEEGAGTSSSSADADLFLPPYAFTRFNVSNFQCLGREPQQVKPSKAAMAAAAGGPIVGLSLRKERRMPCFMVQGHEAFPTEPHPETITQADEKIKLQLPNDLLREIFEERPIWSKNAVMVRTVLEESILKTLMPKYAFYILSGPFGRVWCRFGYDPRQDRNAVAYQTIMINLAKMGLQGEDRLRIGYKVPAANRLKVTSRGLSTGRDTRSTKPGVNWYVFEHGVLPPFRQVWYQVADIRLPAAEEEIQKALLVNDPMYRDGQTENTSAGWLLPGATDRVREAMKDSLKATLDKMDKGERMRPASVLALESDEEDSQESEDDDEEKEYVRPDNVVENDTGEMNVT